VSFLAQAVLLHELLMIDTNLDVREIPPPGDDLMDDECAGQRVDIHLAARAQHPVAPIGILLELAPDEAGEGAADDPIRVAALVMRPHLRGEHGWLVGSYIPLPVMGGPPPAGLGMVRDKCAVVDSADQHIVHAARDNTVAVPFDHPANKSV